MILVPKKGGSFRPEVDYRWLNVVAIPEAFPLLNIGLLLQDISSGNRVFATLDLGKGFLQMPMAKDIQPPTAFSTHTLGLSEFPSRHSLRKTYLSNGIKRQDSFMQLKALLANVPVLASTDFKLPFVLTTDAYSIGLDAILHQKVDGKLRPIAFTRKLLKPAE